MKDHKDERKLYLAHWRDIEPRPGFEDRVWRRVYTAQPSPLVRWLNTLRDWTDLQPAYASAAALLVGAFLGLSAMGTSFAPSARGEAYEMSIVRSGSIAGSYAQLMQESE